MARATRPTAARPTKLLGSCTAAADFKLEMVGRGELLVEVGTERPIETDKVAPYKNMKRSEYVLRIKLDIYDR